MSRAIPQPVLAPLTRFAIFLVVTLNPGEGASAHGREIGARAAALVRAVGSRVLDGELSCVVGFGSQVWERLFGASRPKELHPFRAIHGTHDAVATPGDVFFHVRAARMDLCFEFVRTLMAGLGGAVTTVDEVHGFTYFDQRDLIGFVDGTENPAGEAAVAAALVGAEDPSFAGGSYVIVQKYLHDMAGWEALSTAEQERIIGRAKLANIELDDAVKPSFAHNALTTIEEEDGSEVEIVRRNMPFGRPGEGEAGTYFIGYARSPRPIEQMLTNMFVGRPPGNYDRLLDFSRAVTGTLFFVPAVTFFAPLAAQPALHPAVADGSLGIGSLHQ